MLENELVTVSVVTRIEKMKIRGKIRKQANWLWMLRNPNPEKIFKKLKMRLPDAFAIYHSGFSEQLKEFLETKLTSGHER